MNISTLHLGNKSSQSRILIKQKVFFLRVCKNGLYFDLPQKKRENLINVREMEGVAVVV